MIKKTTRKKIKKTALKIAKYYIAFQLMNLFMIMIFIFIVIKKGSTQKYDKN